MPLITLYPCNCVPNTCLDELLIALSSLIGHTCQVRVSLLAVATHNTTVVELVLTQESLWVVVGVYVDFGQCIVSGWLFRSFMDTRFKPWQQELQPTYGTVPNKIKCNDLYVLGATPLIETRKHPYLSY